MRSVAPLRERELKHFKTPYNIIITSRSLTGAWIETYKPYYIGGTYSRSLTGAWIETLEQLRMKLEAQVAPLRERELKHLATLFISDGARRSLTGAWIETIELCSIGSIDVSLPYGSVNWNNICRVVYARSCVAPLRERELKLCAIALIRYMVSRSLTGAWIETVLRLTSSSLLQSLPYGSVNWNYWAV